MSFSTGEESFIAFIDEVLKDQEMALRFSGGPIKLAGAEKIFVKSSTTFSREKSTLKLSRYIFLTLFEVFIDFGNYKNIRKKLMRQEYHVIKERCNVIRKQ